MSGGGGGSSAPAPKSEAELELEKVNLELARRQLKNVDALAPFQDELLTLSLADLRRSGAEATALDLAVTPAQRAAAAKSDFERSQRIGPIQDELLQMQLEEMRRGGAASPEQIARIKEATERGIEAGSSDIDISTQRGIGLIADELANSRGLRLTDTPIAREASFLARSGQDQKASLIKNLRAGEASAALNFPLAAQQIQSGINLNQQNILDASARFQEDLRQRANQNRLALTGATAQTGIGLASVQGPRPGSPGQTSRYRGADNTLASAGALAGGIGMVALAV